MENNTEKTLGIAIFDVSRAIRRNFDHQSQEFGLSRALWSVLAKLQSKDGLKQIELADVMEIRPITLVKHLDKLEEGGWIVRKDDASDRRAKRIYLTKKANPMIESLNELAIKVRKKALQGINQKEEALFMKMLIKINNNLVENKLP
jgi:DNA-binding MarR family transcriptional regulator